MNGPAPEGVLVAVFPVCSVCGVVVPDGRCDDHPAAKPAGLELWDPGPKQDPPSPAAPSAR